MLNRLVRFLSADSKLGLFKFSVETLSPSNSTPENIEKIVKQYKDLYINSLDTDPNHYWNNDKRILNSISSIKPYIHTLSSTLINELIINLSLLSISNHEIWSELEKLFLEKSNVDLDQKDLPYIIKGFSLVPSKKEFIWRYLNTKMLIYIKNNEVKTSLLALTYISLTNAGQGKEELLNILKNSIVSQIDELTGNQLIELLKNITGKKLNEFDLMELIIEKALNKLNECNLEDLTILHIRMFFTKKNYELIKTVENEILKHANSLTLRHLSGCINLYHSPNLRKKSLYSEFPSILLKYYLMNRGKLISDMTVKQTQAVYEIKILGTMIALGHQVQLEFVKSVLIDIRKAALDLNSNPQVKAQYLFIQNYIKLNN